MRETYLSGKHLGDFDKLSLSIANAWLDADVEGLLGYRVFGSSEEAGLAFNAHSRCSHHIPPQVRTTMCS